MFCEAMHLIAEKSTISLINRASYISGKEEGYDCAVELEGRPQAVQRPPGSSKMFLHRLEKSSYRCFLPDLAGFEAFYREGSYLHSPYRANVTYSLHPNSTCQSWYSRFQVTGHCYLPALAQSLYFIKLWKL